MSDDRNRMRVDIFLKQTRLVKRRSLAKELCDEGAVSIHGRPVRAGKDVAAGDELALNMRHRRLVVEVLEVPSRPPPAARASDFYRIISDEQVEHDGD